MANDRVHEILTQAVVYRETLNPVWSHSIPVQGVRNVLGIKISEDGIALSDQNSINLTARCEVWCEGESGSQVFSVNIKHDLPLDIPAAESTQETMLRAFLTESIRSTDAEATEDSITISLTAVLSVEMIAPVCLTVPVVNPGAESSSLQPESEPEQEAETEAEKLAFVAGAEAPAEEVTPEPVAPKRTATLTTRANSSRVVITYLN